MKTRALTQPETELLSVTVLALLLAWVKLETGRGFVDIFFASLPGLF